MTSLESKTSIKNQFEDFILFWLDVNRDFPDEENISQLKSIFNTVEIFNDFDRCFQRFSQIKNQTIFLISSDEFSNQFACLEENFFQLYAIYLFSSRASRQDDRIQTYKKGKGIFTNFQYLLKQLRKDLRQLEENFISCGTIPDTSASNLNTLEPTFMYCQLIKEKFLKIRYDENSIHEFVNHCRPEHDANLTKQPYLKEFDETYGKKERTQSPIWWYTRDCFLFKTLNRALRMLDIEALMKINFYIRDLHDQIQQRFDGGQDRLPPVVYRGQVLSSDDWDKLRANHGGLYYFNHFLSTSENNSKALEFVRSSQGENKVGVFFKINIDRANSSIPFTSIEDITAIKGEYEILFSIGSVFRIDQINEMEKNLWVVQLTMSNDRDPLLIRLMDHIRRSLGQGSEWRQLGQLMIKMGQFQKGKEIFAQLISQSDQPAELMFLQNQIGYCEKQLANLPQALIHYQQVIDISRRLSISPLDSRLSSTYSNIGAMWKKLKNFDEALKYFQLVLQIDENMSNPNRLEIAIDYNNIGSVLDEQRNYAEALKFYQKAVEIKCVHLPSTDPSLANNYLNIGVVHRKMGDSSTALAYYKKALDIQKKSLTQNHPSLINTFTNMSSVYEHLGQYFDAIQCAEQARETAKIVFGLKHPETMRHEEMVNKLRQSER